MKVIVLNSFNVFSENNATSNRWRTLIEGLASHEVQILYLITSGYKSAYEKLTFGKGGYLNTKIQYMYLTCQNRYNYIPARINNYLINSIYAWANSITLRKIVKSIAPDYILISPTFDAILTFSKTYTRNEVSAQVVTELNEYNDIWDIHATNKIQKWRNRKYNTLLRKKLFPKLDICLVMTDVLIKHYRKFQYCKESLIFFKVPMTVDLKRFDTFSINTKFEGPYIAYCGSGGFYTNGLDILIRSFSLISEDFPNLRLLIAAFWGQDGDRMLELINETKLNKKVVYLGVLGRDEIPPFLQGAEALVLPRPESRQASGGFPTKLGEYLATGRPVCASRVGEIPNYLIDGISAYLHEPGNIFDLADSLKRVLNNKEESLKIGLNGRSVAQHHFNMEVQADRIFDLLKKRSITD